MLFRSRQLLDQAKQVGYTGSILDVFHNPQILDQFVQEQQQIQQQTSPLTAEVRQAPIIAGEQAQFGLGQLEQQLLKLLEQQQIQQDIQTKNKQQTTENIRKGNLNSTPVQNATVESITKPAATEVVSEETTTPKTTHILDADRKSTRLNSSH